MEAQAVISALRARNVRLCYAAAGDWPVEMIDDGESAVTSALDELGLAAPSRSDLVVPGNGGPTDAFAVKLANEMARRSRILAADDADSKLISSMIDEVVEAIAMVVKR